jgi:hypothetical protein
MTRTSPALLCASTFALAIVLCCPGPSSAAGLERSATGLATNHQKGQEKHAKDDGRHVGPPEGERHGRRDAWMDHEQCRSVVTAYYDHRSLPPGLAKRRALPPGLQKQLRERGQLPPGLERHLVPVPVELEHRLPPLPPHHVRRFAGDDLLVIDLRANLVVSITAGVFIRR